MTNYLALNIKLANLKLNENSDDVNQIEYFIISECLRMRWPKLYEMIRLNKGLGKNIALWDKKELNKYQNLNSDEKIKYRHMYDAANIFKSDLELFVLLKSLNKSWIQWLNNDINVQSQTAFYSNIHA